VVAFRNLGSLEEVLKPKRVDLQACRKGLPFEKLLVMLGPMLWSFFEILSTAKTEAHS
jgi:hypothetical protein